MKKEIKTVPNQKIIKVCKEKYDNQNLCATINLKAIEEAAINLDAGSFKLWIYFAKNQDNYEFDLSRQAVQNSFGIKKAQYDRAIKELIEKEYLIRKGNSNVYYFVERPFKKKEKEENTTTSLLKEYVLAPPLSVYMNQPESWIFIAEHEEGSYFLNIYTTKLAWFPIKKQ